MITAGNTLLGHSGAIYDLAGLDNSIFTCSADKFVVRWNGETGLQDGFTVSCPHTPYSISYNKRAQQIWIGLNNGAIHIIDTVHKREIKFYTQHRSAVFSLFYSEANNAVYSSDADGNLGVWNAETLDLQIFLPLMCGKIRKLRTNHSGELLQLNCQDGTIRLFETKGYNEIITLPGHENGTGVSQFLKDDTLLVSGGKDGHIRLWNWQEERLLDAIPAHNFAIYDLQLTTDQRLITASRDKTIKVWHADSLEFVQKIDAKGKGHKHSVNALHLAENKLYSASDDKSVKSWNLI